jgi:hypothetical protein
VSEVKDGGQAFPVAGTQYFPGKDGMSLRDWFAGQALAGWIAGERDPHASAWDHSWWAREAYKCADAMIAAREDKQ